MVDHDSEPRHQIGIVAQRTGLSAHVLRAWERRYGAVEPLRPHGGPRLYSNADIVRFRLLRRLTEAGNSIGRIAHLSTAELLQRLPPEAVATPAAAPASDGNAGDRFVAEALAAVEGMDARNVRAALTRGVVALSAQGFIEGVAVPLLQRVGTLWAEGAICPAHEHLLSVQIGRVLGWLADTIPVPAGAPVAVAATPAGQRHEFGALLASVVAAEEGWAVTYLGPDLPAADIVTAVNQRRARVLLLSSVMGGGALDPRSQLREILDSVDADVQVLVGGSGGGGGATAADPPQLRWLPDFDSLRAALREIGGSG